MTNCKEYYINEFSPDLIAPTKDNFREPTQGGSKLVFIGKPGTGKSTLIRYILYSKMDIIPIALVMNGTEQDTGFYSEIFPPLFVYGEYKEDKIKDFISRQQKAKENITNPWGLLLLDDCTENKKIFNTSLQQSIFKNGRHWKMLYMISLQYSVDLPTNSRVCIDGAFIFKENNEKILRGLYENYAGIIPTFALFKAYMDNVTGDYTALYIDSQNQTKREWFDCVYYVKAPIVPSFKFGSKEYRAYGKERIDPQYLITAAHKMKHIQNILEKNNIIKSPSTVEN
ncbi:ATPase 3 [Dasineura jujubifolia toursvirus 2a]|nr:ATPase 3 [Dasineura jujubifolia toursvirus 2a]